MFTNDGDSEGQHNRVPSSNRWLSRKVPPDMLAKMSSKEVKIRANVCPMCCLHIGQAYRVLLAFYLLYGRGPYLPSDDVLNAPKDQRKVSLSDYKARIMTRCANARKLVQDQIKKTQVSQKSYYDTSARSVMEIETTFIHLLKIWNSL